MERSIRLSATALAFAALLTVSGCGKTISKAEFLKQADAICQKGNTAIDKSVKGVDLDNTTEAAAALSEKVVPAAKKQIRQIRALGFPEGDGAELDAMLDDADALLDKAADDPLKAYRTHTHPFADVDRRLIGYGITRCAAF